MIVKIEIFLYNVFEKNGFFRDNNEIKKLFLIDIENYLFYLNEKIIG